MRGINQYVAFLLLISFLLAGVYFTAISAFLSRSSFSYQYGTAPTQPISASETSDGVVVAFRTPTSGLIAKFSLKGELINEQIIGQYPAIAAKGSEAIVLDDSTRNLIEFDGNLKERKRVLIDEVPMRTLHTTRSRVILPAKSKGRDVILFYDFDLRKLNMAHVPAQPTFSGNAYAYAYNGTCFVGIFDGEIREIESCDRISISKKGDIFALVDGRRVIKFDQNMNRLTEQRVDFEARFISAGKSLYLASENQLRKYDFNLSSLDCELCKEISGLPIFGFSDGGHYLLTQRGPTAEMLSLG